MARDADRERWLLPPDDPSDPNSGPHTVLVPLIGESLDDEHFDERDCTVIGGPRNGRSVRFAFASPADAVGDEVRYPFLTARGRSRRWNSLFRGWSGDA